MSDDAPRYPESMDVVIGQAVHDLTTSIAHKAQTPGALDEDCAVLGRAIADRVVAGRARFEEMVAAIEPIVDPMVAQH